MKTLGNLSVTTIFAVISVLGLEAGASTAKLQEDSIVATLTAKGGETDVKVKFNAPSFPKSVPGESFIVEIHLKNGVGNCTGEPVAVLTSATVGNFDHTYDTGKGSGNVDVNACFFSVSKEGKFLMNVMHLSEYIVGLD